MKRCALACLALTVACPTMYHHVAPNIRVYREKRGANDCNMNRASEAGAAVEALRATAKEQGLLKAWPPVTPIGICIVDSQPTVFCSGQGRQLAGCTIGTNPVEVRVAVHFARKGFLPSKVHDWKATLLHELSMALTLAGLLKLEPPTPQNEPQWVTAPKYIALVKAARARVP